MNLNALRSRQLTSLHSWKFMAHLLTVSTTPPFLRTQTILTRSVNFRHRPPPVPPVSSLITMSSTGINLDSNIDTLMKEKKIIRSKIKRDLKSMDFNLRTQEDEAIQRIVLEAPWFKSCKRLCAYISCSALREVDTSKILSQVLNNPSKDGDAQVVAKKLYVPRVEDKNCYMRMLNISGIDDLVANSMNILEPTSTDIEGHEREDVLLSEQPVELLLLPGLAFDRRGRRLGRGGGYYDTFLSKYQELAVKRTWNQPLLVALSYSLQILDDDVIPVTPHDVLVDALVSPHGVIPISPAAHAWYNS